MKEILFLKPVFKETIWGGNLLKTKFGYGIPSQQTGECWAVSAHLKGDCVVKNGAFKEKALSKLWRDNHELFGNARGDHFPLLTKIIDAREDLSIQVHPDDAYANRYAQGSFGKTECWYILDCKPNATIVIGHHAKNKEELKEMIENKRWKALIREIPIQKGDFFQINPGTVHSIKGGTLLIENQQSSDVTYRVYDYDRLSNGVKRELHLKKSMDVISCPYQEEKLSPKQLTPYRKRFISCACYTVDILEVKGSVSCSQDQDFQILSVIEGEGMIDGNSIGKGDHFILPDAYGDYRLEGDMNIILSYV